MSACSRCGTEVEEVGVADIEIGTEQVAGMTAKVTTCADVLWCPECGTLETVEIEGDSITRYPARFSMSALVKALRARLAESNRERDAAMLAHAGGGGLRSVRLRELYPEHADRLLNS